MSLCQRKNDGHTKGIVGNMIYSLMLSTVSSGFLKWYFRGREWWTNLTNIFILAATMETD